MRARQLSGVQHHRQTGLDRLRARRRLRHEVEVEIRPLALTVLKTRASRHDPDIREFTITPEGIVLGGPLGHSTR